MKVKKPNQPSEIHSCDEIRKAMIRRRDLSLASAKFSAEDAVLFSHVIAWLGYCESLDQWVKDAAE